MHSRDSSSMRTPLAALALAVALTTGVGAGPLFDDYLNPVRPGPGTGPGSGSASTAPGRGVGQTLTLAPDTGEIYRIGVRPVYDSWGPDERVTMTLYDSAGKAGRLAEYSIDAATSRVDQYVAGDGSRFKETGDRVLFFQFRAPAKGRGGLYFELTSTGGDGQVTFQAFKTDVYPGGEAKNCDSVADLAFECHVKPLADREANLRGFFRERLDIERPDLAEVRKAVEASDWELAIAQTVKHFHERMDLWDSWRSVMEVRIDPKAKPDTLKADLIAKGMVQHADTGKPIPWRKESWWSPEIPDAKMPNHGIEPAPFLWHFDRELAGAYTVTGKPEYARWAIDLRMQWILDNPNPKLIYHGDEFPWQFQLWNDRTAAARAPGHGDLVYARLYHFPGWTNDEKLVLLSFFEDNARWLYKCGAGGNWVATAAKAALDFGVAFPEWKISGPCRNWGALRLAELSAEGVRRDGTCDEGAIKYHAMIARRLLGLLKYEHDGVTSLPPGDHKLLLATLNGMYDHMAYVLQPNGYVVMCGDSWHENYTESSNIVNAQVVDPSGLAAKLRESADPVSRRLKSHFSEKTSALLAAWDGRSQPSDDLRDGLVAELNERIKAGDLYDARAFGTVKMRDRTRRMLGLDIKGDDLAFRGKWLIEDAYPDEIAKGYRFGELYEAASTLDRPDLVWIASRGEMGTASPDASKLYPEAGYYIMRSSLDGPKGHYADASQLFIHNGGWFGSHGHWDLTSVNLYAFGRTLIVDPGQYDYVPPPGIDTYWSSKIHSMLVLEGREVKREPGPSRWAANAVINWFDGRHFGYNNLEGVDYVRRRIAFVRPDYFLFDDSAKTVRNTDWAQVWNLTDPNARVDQAAGTIETTFPRGGNVLILNQDSGKFTVERAPGITSTTDEKTAIFRLGQKTDNPRFQTLVYPYEAANRPDVKCDRIGPDDRSLSDLHYSVRVATPDGFDWAVFGEPEIRAAYRNGKHAAEADFAVVRLSKSGTVGSFAWAFGRELTFNGSVLAKADKTVFSLSVRYEGEKLSAEAREPDATIAIAARNCRTFVLNGKRVDRPVVKANFYYPFAGMPHTVVADDLSGFDKITKTNEWTSVADPSSWSGGYTHHETDPGRRESGEYVLQVPKSQTYGVEVFLPRITMLPSDRVEYRVPAVMGKAVDPGGAILEARKDDGAYVFTLNQQAMTGWVKLGDFALGQGELRIRATNVTSTDGVYFIADAVRLVW